MEEFNCQGFTTMSTKELHILDFWRKALIKLYKEKGEVSAGDVGKSVGQSRSTAKKYLDRLKQEKCVDFIERPANNGVMAKYYYPVKAVSQ